MVRGHWRNGGHSWNIRDNLSPLLVTAYGDARGGTGSLSQKSRHQMTLLFARNELLLRIARRSIMWAGKY